MKDITTVLFWLTVILVIVGGWITNIVKIFGSDFDPLTGEVIVRVIGVFLFPVGAIMGFI